MSSSIGSLRRSSAPPSLAGPGDGKVFVIQVERAVQIRSGNQGPEVL